MNQALRATLLNAFGPLTSDKQEEKSLHFYGTKTYKNIASSSEKKKKNQQSKHIITMDAALPK